MGGWQREDLGSPGRGGAAVWSECASLLAAGPSSAPGWVFRAPCALCGICLPSPGPSSSGKHPALLWGMTPFLWESLCGAAEQGVLPWPGGVTPTPRRGSPWEQASWPGFLPGCPDSCLRTLPGAPAAHLFPLCPVGSVAGNRGPLTGIPSFEHACAGTLTSYLLWFTHCSGHLFLDRWSLSWALRFCLSDSGIGSSAS